MGAGRTLTRGASALALGVVAAAIAGCGAGDEERVARACDRFAAPSGKDSASGTGERPYRSVRRLVRTLRAGETGCLRGAFREDVTIRRGGRAGRPVTLADDPSDGRRASLRGRLYVADTANHVTIRGLLLDGRPVRAPRAGEPQLPSPTVAGDFVRFVDNDVTNANTGICFVIGGEAGAARATVIERNRIHHCGKLPPTNHEHGIYLAVSRGAIVRDNVIYANADRGVQLYPDATGTLIERNVIDGNGSGVLFAGDATNASSANAVRDNVISNSLVRYDVGAFWDGGVGIANMVEGNCVWGGRLGELEPADGFEERDNVVADPGFVDRAGGDYRLAPDSPCAGKGPSSADQAIRRLLRGPASDG